MTSCVGDYKGSSCSGSASLLGFVIALPLGAALSALGGLVALFPRANAGLLIFGLSTMTAGAGVLTGIVLAILSGLS